MKAKLELRPERLEDAPRIHEVTREAFRTVPYAAGTEQHIVDALRSEGALALSLVATVKGEVVGHIGFSPVTVSWSSSGWYGLGPVSVLPAFQRQGIGSALIRAGLDLLKEKGAAGCVLAGAPAYYQRFGFAGDTKLELDRVPPSASLFLRFHDAGETGVLKFHGAFFRTYPNSADQPRQRPTAASPDN